MNARWVVKFGGSQYTNPRLAEAARHAGRLRPRPLIVPGGGVFADQVRRAQKRWCFDDAAAHKMALLAMRQYGLLLSALGDLPVVNGCPGYPGSDAPEGVWLPDENERYGAADWHYTSDSVAAWLARRVGADHLVLIKPVKPETAGKPASIQALVDERFMGLVKESDVRVVILDMQGWLDLESADALSGCSGRAAVY